MNKVILLVLLLQVFFLNSFAELPPLPNQSQDFTAVIAQIQQVQTIVITSNETLGSKIFQLGIDLNSTDMKIEQLRAENKQLRQELATKPSAGTMVLITGAIAAIVAGAFITLRAQRRW